MTWRVSYSYGSICECQDFDTEEDAQEFYEMISDRVQDFGDGGEYEPMVSLEEI